MTIDFPDLSELSDADVQQAYAFAASLCQEKQPNINTKCGFISELVFGLDAILSAAQRKMARALLDSTCATKELVATGYSNRPMLEAMIRNAFPGVSHISIVGMGDPEMQRDKHWLFPIALGGRTDIYVRNDAEKIHAYLNRRDVCNPCGDHVVQSATLCRVRMDIELDYRGTAPPSYGHLIDGALVDYIAAIGFVGRFYMADIVAILRDKLPADVSIKKLTVTGTIPRPDGTAISISDDGSALVLPNDPENLITARTTLFMLDPADITVWYGQA